MFALDVNLLKNYDWQNGETGMNFYTGGSCESDSGHIYSPWYTVNELERASMFTSDLFARKLCMTVLFGMGDRIPSSFPVKVAPNAVTESNLWRLAPSTSQG